MALCQKYCSVVMTIIGGNPGLLKKYPGISLSCTVNWLFAITSRKVYMKRVFKNVRQIASNS